MLLEPKFVAVERGNSFPRQAEKAKEGTSGPNSSPEDWEALVSQVKASEETAAARLYRIVNRGIRFYLLWQIGQQDLEDKVHDTFLIVLRAIQGGELREPDRLMGFVRTIVRRQVASYIEQAVHNRREKTNVESWTLVADTKQSPEQLAIIRQKAELMQQALSSLSGEHKQILIRFYLEEQSEAQICRELNLTETRFRHLKWQAKAKLANIGKKKLEITRIVLRDNVTDYD